MIAAIRHVGIVVRDLEKSLAFYSGLLGLSVYLRRVEEGDFIDRLTGIKNVRVEWVKLIIPAGGLIELLQYHSPSDPAVDTAPVPSASNALGCSHVAVTVSDLTALHAKLVSHGFSCKSEPLIAPGGKVRLLYCHDPDGTILELIEDLEPRQALRGTQ